MLGPSASRSSRTTVPLLAAAASSPRPQSGSTVVAVVDRRPPLAVSHDAGRTWRESGGGLPPGPGGRDRRRTTPTSSLYAARNRLYLSRDGGVFWPALAVELPEIEAVELREA